MSAAYPHLAHLTTVADAQQRIRISGIILVMYTPQSGPPARMYMQVGDSTGVAGVTVWGETVNQLMGTADVIGRAISIPGCSMSFYNGKRSLNVPRNHVINFSDASPHAEWWTSKLLAPSITTQEVQTQTDHAVVNLLAVCAGIRREEKTQCKHRNVCMTIYTNTDDPTANGTIKIVAVWNMVDKHGEVDVRDWSGAEYSDSDYVDKTVRLRRVRVTSASNSNVKTAEFMPGANGTKFIIAPHVEMMRWWLGDKYKE